MSLLLLFTPTGAINDTVGLSDNASAVIGTAGILFTSSSTDLVLAGDGVVTALVADRQAADSAGLSDAAVLAAARAALLTDSAGLSDSVTILRTIGVTVTDLAGVTDSATAMTPLALAAEIIDVARVREPITGKHYVTYTRSKHRVAQTGQELVRAGRVMELV